jgi:hypothetical protein
VALNFPDSPTVGQVYTDTTSGFSYEWTGSLWKSYSSATAANIQVLDDISGSFNGVTLIFALTSGGTAVFPVNAQQLDINLGGVIQAPGTDYTISGSNIVFTSPAPTAGLTFSGKLLGTALSLNTIPDGLVTPAKLSTGGPSWNSGGDLNVTGVGTFGNLTVTNDVRVTGVITAVGGFNIGIQSAGTPVTTGPISTLNFAGVGNTFAVNGTTATITISGSGGGSGLSSTGIATAAIFSNPSFITTSFTLNEGNNNYGAFGPISVAIGATITVGAGNTFVVV